MSPSMQNQTGSLGMASGIASPPAPPPVLFPDGRYIAFTGFPVRYTLTGASPAPPPQTHVGSCVPQGDQVMLQKARNMSPLHLSRRG